MASFQLLLQGFSNALSPENLLFALLGSVLGTLVGVLPGIGPTAGIAMLLPVTSLVGPTQAIIMLAAIYYGAAYGGSTTSILMNVPGEAASVVTTIDGYKMARQGKAGAALAIAAISSFVAGTVGLVGLTLFAPALADAALKLGPPEYLGVMVLSLSMIVSLCGASLARGLASAALGMLVALVGLDPQVGISRLTFGWTPLTGGFDMIAVMMGLFAMTEVFRNVTAGTSAISSAPLTSLMIRWSELRDCLGAIFRSVFVGFFLGCLPGCSPSVISFISYDLERRVSKHRGNFGKGAIQGVAAPEGANNACCAGGFVPMLTLGIPTSTSLAVLLGGLMIYGLQPGPLLFIKQAGFVWTVIASMYIGNLILLVLNLPLVGLWARLVRVPYHIIAPLILLFCFLGTYSVRNNFFDAGTCLAFGLLGLLMEKARIPAIPMVLALILGPLLEASLRQTISMGGGSLGILWQRPLALLLLGAGIVVTLLTLVARSGWLGTPLGVTSPSTGEEDR
jgi:putative tricarboxylic transport membrane protein